MTHKKLSLRVVLVVLGMLGVTLGGCATTSPTPTPEALDVEPKQAFIGGERVLILGDSISQNGQYVHYLDGYLQTRFPEDRIELINVGLSSETASGLSEPNHPGRRPHVHDRVDTALRTAQPDVVMVMYGMNDGIYMPFDPERFAAYRAGMRHVIDRIEQAGARPILLTPPPFDPLPIVDKVAPVEAEKHGYQAPYAGYDYVLAHYGDWLLGLREEGYEVVNVGDVSRAHVLDRNAVEPGYTLAPDGVHPNAFGHWMITQAILDDLDLPGDVDVVEIDVARADAPLHVRDLQTTGDGIVSFAWISKVPMPMDDRWSAELVAQERVAERFNRHRLHVVNVPAPEYELYEGEQLLGVVTREQLTAGVDMLQFEALTTNRHAAEMMPLLQERQQMLSQAWRERVGPPEGEATTLRAVQAEAGKIERRLHDLAQPVTLNLRLVPNGEDD
ncbi:MAG: GDSL-type esterase/lipase family protein [Phycisphaeraceae bacterium]